MDGGDIGILFALGSFSLKDESPPFVCGPSYYRVGCEHSWNLALGRSLVLPCWVCRKGGWKLVLPEHIRILEPSPCIDSRAQTF